MLKKEKSYTSSPPVCLHVMVRDIFTLIYTFIFTFTFTITFTFTFTFAFAFTRVP